MADRLDYILDEYEQRAARQTTAEDIRHAEEVEFLAEFRKLADSVIVPTLEELAERLRSRGHGAVVHASGAAPVEHTSWLSVAVVLVIQPAGQSRADAEYRDPYVSFTAMASRRTVEIHEWHAGGGAPAGVYALDALDRDTVRHIALDGIERVLNPPRSRA